MNNNFEVEHGLKESLVYEVIVELAGEVFVLQKSVSLTKQDQVSIAYKNPFLTS